MLTLGLCAALSAQQQGALDATLAQFPDDRLPALLGRLAARDAAAASGLAALGRSAHEALLGAVLDPMFPKNVGLLQAFGAFDARCAWALPLLGDPEVPLTNEVQELLLRLGPAAAPLVPQLTARAQAARQGHLRDFVERLTAATDGPVPASDPSPRPRVAPDLVPALLGCLRDGPDERRWPALQALLCVGDDAATEATETLLRLSLQPGWLPRAEDLLLTLRCVYSTRCLQGRMPLQTLPPEDLPVEARRRALAGRVSDFNAVQVWQRSADAGLRRTAALVASKNGPAGFPLPLPRSTDGDATVEAAVELVRALRRRDGAAAARDALPRLRVDDLGESLDAMHTLARHDLRDAPEELWTIVLGIGTEPVVTSGSPRDPLLVQTRSRRDAALRLLDAAVAAEPVPDALVANLPRLAATESGERRVRTLLEHVELRALEQQLRAASEDPVALAPWLAALRMAGQPLQRRPELDALVTALAPLVPDLPPAAQLDWLELDRRTAVSDAVWRALLGDSDVAIRRRATELAWRGLHLRPFPPDLVLPLLHDPDPAVARNTAFLLAQCKTGRERAVDALVAAFPTADAELQQWIVFALWGQREVAAPARATIDAAFASGHPKVRVHAAMLRLFFDRDDATAFAELQALVRHADVGVRQHALYQAGNDQAIATRLVDAAIAALDHPDEQVAYAAARLLGNAPQARDRSLPALRASLDRTSSGSLAAQRIQQAITNLERPDTAAEAKR